MSIQASARRRRLLVMTALVLIIAAILLVLPRELKLPAFILVVLCSPLFGIVAVWMKQRSSFLSGWARRFFAPAINTTKKLSAPYVRIVSKYYAAIAHVLTRCLELLNRRNRGFLIGITLIGLAQYLLSQPKPVVLSFVFTNSLEQTFKTGIGNVDNFLLAAGLLILAAVSILRTLSLPPSEPVVVPETIPFPSLISLARRLVIPLVIAAVLYVVLLWQLAHINSSNSLVWIVVLLIVAFFGFGYDRNARTRLTFKINRWDTLFIGAIFVGGLLIGSYQLDRLPNSIIADEGQFFSDAKTAASKLDRSEFFDMGVYSFPQASTLYQALILKLFGVSLWSWRFSSVLAGLLAVIPTYLLALTLFDRRMAVLTSTLMVLTPWLIAFDRMGYNNSQAIFPVALTAYFLWIAFQRQSVFYSILSGMAGGLGFYTYSAGKLGLVLGIVFILYLVVAQRIVISRQASEQLKKALSQEIRKYRLLGAAFVITAIIFIAPLLVYGYARNPLTMRQKTLESIFPTEFYAQTIYKTDELYRDFPPIRIDNQTFFFRADLYGALLLRGAVRSMLAFQDADVVRSHFLAAPLAGTVGAIFYFFGLVFAFAHIKDRRFGLILVWFLTGIVMLSIINAFPPRAEHMVSVIPPMCILIALGIETSLGFIRDRLRLTSQRVVTALTIVILGSIVFPNIQNYFQEVPRLYTPNPENVMSFAALQLQEPRNLIYVSSDPRQQAAFVPFLAAYLPNQAKFLTVNRDQFIGGQYVIRPGENYTFYFLPDDAKLVVPCLQKMFHQDVLTPETYTNRDGKAVLLAWSFDQKLN